MLIKEWVDEMYAQINQRAALSRNQRTAKEQILEHHSQLRMNLSILTILKCVGAHTLMMVVAIIIGDSGPKAITGSFMFLGFLLGRSLFLQYREAQLKMWEKYGSSRSVSINSTLFLEQVLIRHGDYFYPVVASSFLIALIFLLPVNQYYQLDQLFQNASLLLSSFIVVVVLMELKHRFYRVLYLPSQYSIFKKSRL